MDALVLSGGSIKGSWQAGAIAEVLAAGITPSIVTGTSVGAINTAALAAWQPIDITDSDEWAETGADLAAFWETQITRPSQIARKRRWYELLYRVLFKKWAGLVDMSPVEKLIRETLGTDFSGPLTAEVAAVSLRSGRLLYFHSGHSLFLDAVMASAMEPIAMPTYTLADQQWVDGGAREIAPLAEAIKLGATRIVVIVCQPEGTRSWGGNPGDLMKLIGRVESIVTDEIVSNDIRRCQEINEAVDAGDVTHAGKRIIDLTVIRPLAPLAIDIMDFDQADIKRMVQQGREDARRVLGGAHGVAAA